MEIAPKVKHLEMIQAVVARLNGNSFLLKGWGTTLASALLVLEARSGIARVAPVALGVLLVFWALDAYYLWQERRFRRLYDLVRSSDKDLNFTMDLTLIPQPPHYAGTWASFSVYWLWVSLLLVVAIAWGLMS